MKTLYLSPFGNDAWSGRRPEPNRSRTDGPLATLERARDLIRAAQAQEGTGGYTVLLRGGCYFRDQTFDLTGPDSGCPGAPNVYAAFPGEEVRLIGGKRLRQWSPVSDPAILRRLPPAARKRVRQCALRAEGITDFGVYQPRGHSGGSAHAPLELFFNGAVMTVSRWPKKPPLPNRGFVDITDFKDELLYFQDTRARRWTAATDIHVQGYFACDWASSIARVETLDPVAGSIRCVPPNLSAYGARKGGRFFFFNLLEELGEPGEWYLDRATGILYFWPPTPLRSGEAIASVLDGPLIRLTGVDHVRFERLTIEAMRGDGVAIEDGTHNEVAGCALRNIGRHGVSLLRGFDHAVVSCDIYETGECGVDILAGDRKTLTPCRHRVHNCHLHHIARQGWTYFNAVRMAHHADLGCGAIITHNRMHEHRHALIHFKGNDHLIEKNDLYNMTLEGDDCGAIYTGRDFSMQGHVIRYNYIHHVGDSGRNDWGSFGVYMDDCGGGTEIYGNIFHYIDKAVLAGGGVNIRIHDNIFVHCNPAIWFDERGASAGADGPGSMVHDTMRASFEHVGAHQPGPYAKYPNLESILRAFAEHRGMLTWGGGVYRNVIFGAQSAWLATYWTAYPEHFEFHDNWVGDTDPGFVDPEFDRYALRPDAPLVRQIGMAPIPFAEIGLQRDDYRTRLVEALVRLETVKPIGGRGDPGRGRLTVRNIGDTEVAGDEIVEFKIRRHGPGIGFVRVPYRVAPGQTASFDFAIDLDPTLLAGCFELFMCSRGEGDLRPYWTRTPIAYVLDSALVALTPLTATGSDAPAARVKLALRNVSTAPVNTQVDLAVEPEAGVVWEDTPSLPVTLAPGASLEKEFAFRLAPSAGALVSRVALTTRAPGIKPTRLPWIVEYPLRRFPAAGEPGELADLLAREPVFPVRGQAKNTLPGDYGEIRLGMAGDEFAVYAEIRDPQPRVTPMMWDGSCIEIYACSPDRERIGHVFGNIPIGQVYLVPAFEGQPARGLIEQNNRQVIRPDIRVVSEPREGGYRLMALVPLPCLAQSPGCTRFLFEIQVGTPFGQGYLAGRGNLFGSYSAFNDTTRYALAVIP